MEIKHLLKSCSLSWQDLLPVSVVLWISFTMGVVTPRGKKKKIVEKGIVRWILANCSGFGGNTAARQQTSVSCRVQEWETQTCFRAKIYLWRLQETTVHCSLCQQKGRRHIQEPGNVGRNRGEV